MKRYGLYRESDNNNLKRWLLVVIPALLLFVSCATSRFIEVPVETVRTEYVVDVKRDSVYIRDSIDRFIKGDTIYVYRERIKFKYIIKTDTIIKIDSIPKIIKIEEVKEVKTNILKWYQKALMWVGGCFVFMILGYVFFKMKIR